MRTVSQVHAKLKVIRSDGFVFGFYLMLLLYISARMLASFGITWFVEPIWEAPMWTQFLALVLGVCLLVWFRRRSNREILNYAREVGDRE